MGKTRHSFEDVTEGDFGVGEKAVPENIGKIGVSGGEQREVVLGCPYCPLYRVGPVYLWGTNCTGNRCERKYSLHFNELSSSTMRLGRGREWAVKKARMEEKRRK